MYAWHVRHTIDWGHVPQLSYALWLVGLVAVLHNTVELRWSLLGNHLSKTASLPGYNWC